MKGNESPKGQKLQNVAGLGADKMCLNFVRNGPFLATCEGDRTWQPRQAKNERNEGPKVQNEKK